jgi:hypothetical protein
MADLEATIVQYDQGESGYVRYHIQVSRACPSTARSCQASRNLALGRRSLCAMLPGWLSGDSMTSSPYMMISWPFVHHSLGCCHRSDGSAGKC